MIYGPKDDGTYVVEFQTADGESANVSSALLGPWCQVSRHPGHTANTKDSGHNTRRPRARSAYTARTN
jgi:hypothetical protein